MTFYDESDVAAATNLRNGSGMAAKMNHASTLRGSDYNSNQQSKLETLKNDLAKFSKKHALSTKRSEEKL